MSRGAAALAACALALTGCGGADGAGEEPVLIVSAAASLKAAFEAYARDFEKAEVRYSFAGSDELAAQIRQGAKPDVYAAANTRIPQTLYDEGRLERPVVFVANRLVLAVPTARGNIGSLEDLARPGIKLAIGAPSVPVGSYTRELLSRLGDGVARRILANVRSNEPDVAGVVGKLTQGAADAGFVYATDVVATRGRLRAIELPGRLEPSVRYGIAVVRGGEHRTAARAFVGGLLEGAGREVLRRAGFQPPPP
jgi:molybdate transport system substrate-binding protein